MSINELAQEVERLKKRINDVETAMLEAQLRQSIPIIEAEARKVERERIDSLRDKALEVIEYLTCDDDFALSDSRECKLLTKIYTYAHVARGHCENPHEDWRKELEETWQALKSDG